MAAAVAVPFHTINEQLGGVLPPSAVAQHSSRHGRGRGMSLKGGKSSRGRRYSVVEDADVTLAKALMFVLKRTIKKDKVDDEAEVDNLVEDADGWVAVSDVLEHPRLKPLDTDLSDLERIISNASKARFELEKVPDLDAYRVRRLGASRESAAAPVPVGAALTSATPDLPAFIVYETSYQRYPLIQSSGAITRAPTGTRYLSFTPVTIAHDGTETRHPSAGPDTADVSIWIPLHAALHAAPGITFHRTADGAIITSDEVPISLWHKAVARRPDIGLLFEDGEVKKEIPAGLRGRGAKGKGKKGNQDQMALKKAGSASEDNSAGGSAEGESEDDE